MGRIKLKDLPEDMKISLDEMKRVHGGSFFDITAAKYVGPRFEIGSLYLGSLRDLEVGKW